MADMVPGLQEKCVLKHKRKHSALEHGQFQNFFRRSSSLKCVHSLRLQVYFREMVQDEKGGEISGAIGGERTHGNQKRTGRHLGRMCESKEIWNKQLGHEKSRGNERNRKECSHTIRETTAKKGGHGETDRQRTRAKERSR